MIGYNAQVYTLIGWKPITEVTSKDEILCYDIKERLRKYVKVNKLTLAKETKVYETKVFTLGENASILTLNLKNEYYFKKVKDLKKFDKIVTEGVNSIYVVDEVMVKETPMHLLTINLETRSKTTGIILKFHACSPVTVRVDYAD